MTSEKTARGNRQGLALVGVLLLAVGLLSLARGRGLLLGLAAGEPLLSERLRRLDEPDWWWFAVAVAWVLLALVALRWLLVQSRSDHLRRLILSTGTTGRTVLETSALTDAVADDIDDRPGVRHATVRLLDSRRGVRLHAVVVVEEAAEVAAVRRFVETEALPRARSALAADALEARVVVRIGRHIWWGRQPRSIRVA